VQLGEFGLWTVYRAIGEENAGEAARLAEELGYGTFWLGGSPQLPSVRPLLAGSGRLTVATGIVNVWQYQGGAAGRQAGEPGPPAAISGPAKLAAEHAALTAEFPGRLLLGIGIGHREHTLQYASPLATMRAFFDGLDAAPTPVPREERCAAALGPKMLDLVGERSLGTHPYFTPVEHTRFCRARLGPDALVAPELACVLDSDPDRARATARRYAELYLGLSNYTGNLQRLGYSEQDLANGGSNRLIDAVVPHGDAQAIAEVARAHLDAGADHVCLQPLGTRGVPRREWTELAAALGL
jgi:probable F420-dependent oxidoreductase